MALFADVVYFMVIAVRGDSLIWFASLLFLYLLVEAAAFFSVIEVALVAAVSAMFCAVLPFGNRHELERTIVVSGAFAWGCAVSKRRQAAQIESLRESLQGAQIAAGKAREEEAKRIAADFHDGPLQSFISLQMRLEILRKLLDRDFNAGMEDLRQLQTLAQDQIRDLRAFLHSMRPVDVDGGNMIANARRTAESFQKETGIPVTFIGANSPVGLPQEMTLEVLQMIREALHNVQKHAGATRVAVAMEKTERGLEISIDDNGHGFPFAGSYSLEELELLRLGPRQPETARPLAQCRSPPRIPPRPRRRAQVPGPLAMNRRRPVGSRRRISRLQPLRRFHPSAAPRRRSDLTFAFDEDPEPVLSDGVDALNPSVVRFTGLTNLYSVFDGKTWSTALAISNGGSHWQSQGLVVSPGSRPWEGEYIAANGSARGTSWRALVLVSSRTPKRRKHRSRPNGLATTDFARGVTHFRYSSNL